MDKYIVTTHGDRKLIKVAKPQPQKKWKGQVLAIAIAAAITAPIANAGYLVFSDNSKSTFAYSTQYSKKQAGRSLTEALSTNKRIVKVVGAAHFSSGQMFLSQGELERLDAILTRLPNNATVIVVGNTDAPGSQDNNYALGYRRAQGVADYIRTKQVEVVDVWSKGEDNLLVDTQRSSWINRRIDLIVKYDIKDEPTGQIRVRPDGKPYWWQKN